MDRRDFLTKSASVIGATTIGSQISQSDNLPQWARSVHQFDRPKTFRVGLIGSGWYGKVDVFRLLAVARDEVEVVALCDVDSAMLDQAAKLTAERQKNGKEPAKYSDYRKMLADREFDLMFVGTPDHWHALPMIEACKAGADVYVQKPISVDLVEGEAMVAAARKYNRVVQVGTQRRSTPHLLEARDKFIKTGRLGKIGSVAIHSFYRGRQNIPNKIVKPPASLDYDMWCGPAPKRPFYEKMHPVRWRAFTEYGNGQIGDLCVHFFDLIRYFLDLGWPQHISCSGGEFVDTENVANIPDTQDAVFAYDGLNVTWTCRAYGPTPEKNYPWAVFIHGSEGTLKMNLTQYEFVPFGKGAIEKGTYLEEPISELERAEERFNPAGVGATRRHVANFLECVKTREKPVADILEGHISSASCILANNVMEVGQATAINTETGRPVGNAAIEKKLSRPYREPWIHPDPETV